LFGADCRNANLRQANLEGTNLDNTKFRGAVMPDGSTHY
jgi:uncharacterized protein YjbI with pentapeptide repeats